MRKGFNGLYGLVRDHLGCDPESGHVFLFTNARRNRLKLLVYDHSGAMGMLEEIGRGKFLGWPGADTSETKIVLSHEELALLLGGIDLSETGRRKWYRKRRRWKNQRSYESPCIGTGDFAGLIHSQICYQRSIVECDSTAWRRVLFPRRTSRTTEGAASPGFVCLPERQGCDL